MRIVCLLAVSIAMLALASPSVWSADTRELTVFTIASHTDPTQRFAVATDDPELIQRCRDQLSLPEIERSLHVNGHLAAGHGGVNLGWSWHLEPDGWDLVEDPIEVCDGRPSFVEEDLPYWLGSVGSFCPWSSFVAAEGAPYALTDPATVMVELEEIVSGLSRPLAVTVAGDGSGRLFVVEQRGRIRIVENGVLLQEPFLDISNRVRSTGNEQGLLGLAFHPAFPSPDVFFVNYTDLGGDTVVASYRVREDDPDRADPASEQLVLTIDQPYSNHNGGHLVFGPDGHLRIGTGDGGSAGDPDGNAGNPQSLLGKMLRLEVGSGPGYMIPVDNPFVADPGTRDEIWALGLRNPWRYSFDRATGDLYIADVGQNTWEEVDVEGAADPGGRDYGWNTTEGSRCFQSSGCFTEGLSLPVAEYDHAEGCSVTGGHVYRGTQQPVLAGLYIFADYCSGRIWALAPGYRTGWAVARVGSTSESITSFGEDDDGELYAVTREGSLYRITARLAPREPRRAVGRTRPQAGLNYKLKIAD